MLTKRMEKKLDGNCTRMLWAELKKSWRRHTSKQQLYGQVPPISKTIQIKRTRHAGHYWRSKDEHISVVSRWKSKCWVTSEKLKPKVAWKTWRSRWTIKTSGERGFRKSVLAIQHDNKHEWVQVLLITPFKWPCNTYILMKATSLK